MDKLKDVQAKLDTARHGKRESEREAKTKECLETLKRVFPGVHGRMLDLCKPVKREYDLAVSVVLGRNIDAIVVDDQKTALECIQYLREQRVGQFTFLPLDTLQIKPINEKLRTIAKGARLALDVIQYDQALAQAMQYACGNAIVCDTLAIAKSLCYDQNLEVKAVSLDGTLIHKNGMITGGQMGSNQGARWEDKELDSGLPDSAWTTAILMCGCCAFGFQTGVKSRKRWLQNYPSFSSSGKLFRTKKMRG